MLKEFRDFIARGNVVDLAVGVVIGAAFGKIVTSLVEDIVMPPIGLVLGRVDFSNLFINLSDGTYQSVAEAKAAGAATLNYGMFINALIGFLIVALAIFLLVRAVNRIRRETPPEPAMTNEEKLLTEIRDLLQSGAAPSRPRAGTTGAV